MSHIHSASQCVDRMDAACLRALVILKTLYENGDIPTYMQRKTAACIADYNAAMAEGLETTILLHDERAIESREAALRG